jgi:hypothetical protein
MFDNEYHNARRDDDPFDGNDGVSIMKPVESLKNYHIGLDMGTGPDKTIVGTFYVPPMPSITKRMLNSST